MYSNNFESTIQPGCPWHNHQLYFGPPNVNWCEPTICSWINEPFNAWSNLGYLILGLVLIFKSTHRLERQFGGLVLFTGLASFIYHSTNNFFTQYFDYLGMIALLSFAISFNISRILNDNQKISLFLGWILSFYLVALNLFMMLKIPIQLIVLLGCGSVLILEIVCFYILKTKSKIKLSDLNYFILSLLFLGLGQTFAVLDLNRVYCPTQLWITGHVLWHFFGALGLGFYALHLKKSVVPQIHKQG